MNRLTITLDDDLYAMARAHAVANHKSISKAIGDLLRQGRTLPPATPPSPESSFHIDPVTQLPVVPGRAKRITTEDVRRAEDDEDARHLEFMGLSPEQIEQSLDR